MVSSCMTIQAFAMEIQVSVDYLMKQFLEIGINKTEFDFVTQIEKEMLFKHLNYNNSTVFNKFSLKRKTHSTLNIPSISGKNKRVQVEVRRKRVYMVQCSLKQNVDSVDVGLYKQQKDHSKSKYVIGQLDNVISDRRLIDLDKCEMTNVISVSNSNSYINNIDDSAYDVKSALEIQDNYKIHKKDQLIFGTNNKEGLNKKKDLDSSFDKELSVNNLTVKNVGENFKKFNDISILIDSKRYDNQSENNHKPHRARVRVKHKNSGKLIRNKRYNNVQVNSDVNNEFDRQGKLSTVVCRFNKHKRKSSSLIQSFSKPVDIVARNIIIGDTVSVAELSSKMSVKSSYMIKVMMKLGLMVTVNQILDQETAQLVVEEMGHSVILQRKNELEESVMMHEENNFDSCYGFSKDVKNNKLDKNRAPVVAIMGHVDHGKTSILDYIRFHKIISNESGGITQKIGAYCVDTHGGMITFLDTPGHEAFINMRARGVQLTDIVVLVVAADDGVMPQTVEAINHIRNINLPVVVAINKIDKSQVNIERIKHELNNYGLIPEEWGGNTQFVNVSAISGKGIHDLLDAILLQSEMLELKTIHSDMARAVVIDSSIDKNRGPVVIVLVRSGELKSGDMILCGSEYGRIKAMKDMFGCDVCVAGPSVPVELLGLSGAPNAGELMIVVKHEKKAKEVALYRKEKKRALKLTVNNLKKADIENVFNNIKDIKVPELSFIVKSDTQGSIEAICESLRKLSTSSITIKVLSASVGNITETDAMLALTSNAIILGFNVKTDSSTRDMIELHRLNVRYYSVIYNLLDEVNQLISDTLIPKHKYQVIGVAQVSDIFRSKKYGTIAGCVVMKGIIKANKKIKIIRNNVVIYEGELDSLRHFKSDVHEVKSGIECGICVKNYSDVCSGDMIESLDTI